MSVPLQMLKRSRKEGKEKRHLPSQIILAGRGTTSAPNVDLLEKKREEKAERKQKL